MSRKRKMPAQIREMLFGWRLEIAYWHWQLDKAKGKFYPEIFKLQSLPASLRISDPLVRGAIIKSRKIEKDIGKLEADILRQSEAVKRGEEFIHQYLRQSGS